MVEVERKRQYRVGLILFNTSPETDVDYLGKGNILELSPWSVRGQLRLGLSWRRPLGQPRTYLEPGIKRSETYDTRTD